MSRALAITNAAPVENVIGNLHDAIAILQTAPKPDMAEIKIGSMTAFSAWCERRFITTANGGPREKPYAPSLMGIPVVVSALLPPNRAALFVNNEVRAIIDLDADAGGGK